jgi:hypothetical protein
MMNRRDKASGGRRGGLKRPDEVGEVAHDHCPDEFGKSSVKPAKGVLNGVKTAENLRISYLVGVSFSRGAFIQS